MSKWLTVGTPFTTLRSLSKGTVVSYVRVCMAEQSSHSHDDDDDAIVVVVVVVVVVQGVSLETGQSGVLPTCLQAVIVTARATSVVSPVNLTASTSQVAPPPLPAVVVSLLIIGLLNSSSINCCCCCNKASA